MRRRTNGCWTAAVGLAVGAVLLPVPARAQTGRVTVNPRTGNATYVQDDLVLPTRGVDFVLRRTYQSRSRGRGQYGWCWASEPADVRLVPQAGGDHVVLYPGDGTWLEFLRDTDGVFRPPAESCSLFSEIQGETGERREYRRMCPDTGEWQFDPAGWLTSRAGGSGGGYRLYRVGGRILRVEIEGGATLQFFYDAAGRIVRVTDGGARSWVYQYDSYGDLVGLETSPGPTRESYEYDRHHNLTRVTHADGSTVELTYNDRDWITSEIGPGDRSVRYTYSPDASPAHYTVEVTSGDTKTLYEYWPAQQRRRRTDRAGTLEWWLDTHGRPLTERRPDGDTRQYHYDSEGRLERVTDPSGAELFTYDPATGYLVGAVLADGQRYTYSYALDDRLTRVERGGAPAAVMTYTDAGQVADVTLSGDRRMELAYDDRGRLAGIHLVPSGADIALVYNDLGELSAVDTGGQEAHLVELRRYRDELAALVTPVTWDLFQ